MIQYPFPFCASHHVLSGLVLLVPTILDTIFKAGINISHLHGYLYKKHHLSNTFDYIFTLISAQLTDPTFALYTAITSHCKHSESHFSTFCFLKVQSAGISEYLKSASVLP